MNVSEVMRRNKKLMVLKYENIGDVIFSYLGIVVFRPDLTLDVDLVGVDRIKDYLVICAFDFALSLCFHLSAARV